MSHEPADTISLACGSRREMWTISLEQDESCRQSNLNSEKGAELHVNMYRATKVSHETLHMM